MKTKMKKSDEKNQDVLTMRRLAGLSVVAMGLGLATTGCDSEMEERGGVHNDYQTLGDLSRPPRDFAQHRDDSAERIQNKLFIQGDELTKPLYYLAHYLGYAWVGGNGSEFVGEDMRVIEESSNRIVFQGNNDGDCDGYRCGDKTKITLSNFAYMLDGDSFEQGEISRVDSDGGEVLTGRVINLSDQEQTFVAHIKKNVNTNWTKSNEHSVGLSVSYTEEVKLPLGAGASITVGAETGRTWGETNGGSEDTEILAQVRAVVPAHSWMPFVVELKKTEVSYPYAFKARLSYDVNFEGFLRWSGNAWHSHPEDRPNHSYTFIAGRESDVATNLDTQWGDRDLGYVKNELWDWQWAIDEFGEGDVEWAASESIRPTLVDVKGVFTAEDAWAADAIFGEVTYFDADDPPAGLPGEDGVWGDDGQKWPEGEGE